jgi:transcription elongation GreA/GreB family factor
LGLALLGCREGDVMEWPMQEGPRRLRIDARDLPAEAAGNFFV